MLEWNSQKTIMRYGKQYRLYSDSPMRESAFNKLRKELRGGLLFVTLPAGESKTTKYYWVYYRKTSITQRVEKKYKSGLPLHIKLKDHRAYKEKYPPYYD
jgi:hypothetical protein